MYRQEINYNAVRKNFIEFQKPITDRSLTLNQKINLQRKRMNFLADFSTVLRLNAPLRQRVIGRAKRYLNNLEDERRMNLARRLLRPPTSNPFRIAINTAAMATASPRRANTAKRPAEKNKKPKTVKSRLKQMLRLKRK